MLFCCWKLSAGEGAIDWLMGGRARGAAGARSACLSRPSLDHSTTRCCRAGGACPRRPSAVRRPAATHRQHARPCYGLLSEGSGRTKKRESEALQHGQNPLAPVNAPPDPFQKLVKAYWWTANVWETRCRLRALPVVARHERSLPSNSRRTLLCRCDRLRPAKRSIRSRSERPRSPGSRWDDESDRRAFSRLRRGCDCAAVSRQ